MEETLNAPPTYDESQALKTSIFQHETINLPLRVYGTFEEPLFKASEVGRILGLVNINKNLTDENKYRPGKDKVITLSATRGGAQNVTFTN